jgi:hypothetical protein
VKFYLSKRGGNDQFGANLDEDDVLIGQALDQTISIPNGGKVSVPGTSLSPFNLSIKSMPMSLSRRCRPIAGPRSFLPMTTSASARKSTH